MTTAIIIAVACILVAGLFAVIVERTDERDEALANYATEVFENARLRARLAELEAEADELNQENMALHLQLTETQIAAGALESLPSLPHPRPSLSLVTQQNADDAWWDRLYGGESS
jgi:hypothetical protein